MEIKSIHILDDVKPFIKFEANVDGDRLQLEGHEYYCIETSCNCQMVNIMIHEVGGVGLTQLIYGWRPYKHYLKQHFLKSDCQLMVKGGLSFPEPRTHLNKMILAGFHDWLKQNKKEKDKLFAERYEKVRKKIIEIREEKFDDFAETEVLSDNKMIELLKNLTQSDISDLIELYEKITKK